MDTERRREEMSQIKPTMVVKSLSVDTIKRVESTNRDLDKT